MNSRKSPAAEPSSHFAFAFNNPNFSDRVLRIEILPDSKPRPDEQQLNSNELTEECEEQILNCTMLDSEDGVTYENQEEAAAVIPDIVEATINRSGHEAAHSKETSSSMDYSSVRLKPIHISSPILAAKNKTQVIKQKNSSTTSRRGDKRSSKVHKNRCDSFSLKNGSVGFNSAAGGNNFFGMYGLKPEVFDVTKYIEELSLDELLHGSYTCPNIGKDKGKKTANSNTNLLQSVRKACSLLQDQRGLQANKSAEIDNSFQNISTGMVTASPATGQTDSDKGDSCTSDMPSSDKVQESGDKNKTSTQADCLLYQPKDILERLALPPPKDLDSLLSDANKTANSKNCSDPRLSKQVSHRTGLPPFPWSQAFSGHNKLGTDAIKLSASRTICPGRWVKVQNCTALQKGSDDFLVDFESLTFDQSLVPSTSLKCENSENKFAPNERVISAGACSSSKVPAEEHSPTHAAAQTLLDMAAHSSKENPCAAIKLLKKHSQTAMKSCKLKTIARPDKFSCAPKSTRPVNAVKWYDDGSPSKKLRLSSDVTITPSFRPPPRKLFRDSDTIKNSYSMSLVKKTCMMKPPRSAEMLPRSSRQKLRKSFFQ